jgi:hypothetical protein
MKLDVWTRAGLTATLMWVVGSGVYWADKVNACQRGGYCDFVLSNASGTTRWFWLLPSVLGLWRLGLFGNALFATIVAPGLVWAAAGLVGWVLAGRANSR